MSTGKETLVLITVVNLVLTVAIVGLAMAFFVPEATESAPADTDVLTQKLAEVERRLEAEKTTVEELRLEFAEQARRLAVLERAPMAAAGRDPASASAGGPAAEGKTAAPSMESELVKGIGQMIKMQARRQRDRFLSDVMNPTPQSQERQARQIRGIVDMVSRNLELDERDRASVERILTDVEEQRRTQLREIVQSKESRDDVSYEDVRKVLDDSFEDEDRQIQDALPADKAKQYKESAAGFRQFILVAAQAAFPKRDDKDESGSGK